MAINPMKDRNEKEMKKYSRKNTSAPA